MSARKPTRLTLRKPGHEIGDIKASWKPSRQSNYYIQKRTAFSSPSSKQDLLGTQHLGFSLRFQRPTSTIQLEISTSGSRIQLEISTSGSRIQLEISTSGSRMQLEISTSGSRIQLEISTSGSRTQPPSS